MSFEVIEGVFTISADMTMTASHAGSITCYWLRCKEGIFSLKNTVYQQQLWVVYFYA